MLKEEEHSKPIFALDIGTRSVVGLIVIQKSDGHYQIMDYVIEEHQERSMLDGQIHDVIAVAEVIKKVKSTLETKYGPLKKVAVAAAGRSLKTQRATIEHGIVGRPLLTKEDISAMELEAVQLAQTKIAENHSGKEQQTNFYCVGYSVIRYLLDDDEIGNLIDQRGGKTAVEIIATFLPRIVVDSLISSLKRADLEMEALTLEPIAAINVLIPTTMRRLNVALVDIGAGTSDVAITSEGAITAYGMVPYAGDEITDALSQQYLLDFPVAENIKRKLYEHENVQFDDILGYSHSLSSTEVVQTLQANIQSLAEKICRQIMHLNGKSPQAVMLIGGGSLMPTLGHWVAEILGLPQNRVGIRGLQSNQNITIESEEAHFGPESVTPIGIAIAAKQHPVKYISVQVNQNTVRLFDLRRLTIGDAILASGINIAKLHGKPGLALSIEVNGALKLLPGTHGQPPNITCNAKEVTLDTPLQANDQIEVVQGRNGTDAKVCVKEVLQGVDSIKIHVNGILYSIPPVVTVNDQTASLETPLHERDRVMISTPRKIEDVLQGLEWSTQELYEPQGIHIYFNDEMITIDSPSHSVTKNDQPSSLEDLISNGDKLTIQSPKELDFLFHDVFRYIEMDLDSIPKGKRMVLTINNISASFDSPISDGDRLELRWES